MARNIVGCGGGFSGCSGLSADWESWTITVAGETAQARTFSKQGWASQDVVGLSWNGSVVGLVQFGSGADSPMGFVGTSAPSGCAAFDLLRCNGAVFTAETGCTYSGDIIFSNVSMSRTATDYMRISADFVGDGALIEVAWDSTSTS